MPQRTVIGLHLLNILIFVSSRRIDKIHDRIGENELFENTHVITVKFPKISSNVPRIDSTIARRKIHTNVQPVHESCQTKTFKTELSQLRQKTKCEPRETIVDLISPFGDLITPNAVVVKRCGGMCSGSKKCLPVQRVDTKFYVKTVKNNQMYCSSILVPEDTECTCACQQTATDCNENHTYNKERCACVCKNEKDYVQCVESPNEDLHWDEKSCSCVCLQSKSCTTGTFWMESECRCAKMYP